MFDFIPVKDYYPIYINVCLVIIFFTLFHTYILKMDDRKNISFVKIMGLFLLVSLIIYLGMRPVNGIYFGDTVNYNKAFQKYAVGGNIGNESDYYWHVFMKFMAHIIDVHVFFSLCTFLYIFPKYHLSKKVFGNYGYYAFIMFIVSFSFYTYAVNGVRNGVALSLFLWGLCFRDKKFIMSLFFFVALAFHKSSLLPISAYLITYIYNKPKGFFIGWLLCIPLSLTLGSMWISLFTSLGFGDDRLSGYLSSQAEQGVFTSTGFRWDFLFYSSFPVIGAVYFIYKKKFEDKFYYQLLNTYLICNGFWILVIRANYSNRFAYLSWFLMAILIIYPLLKQRFFKNQHFIIGKILLVYFAFTYAMFYLYYNGNS